MPETFHSVVYILLAYWNNTDLSNDILCTFTAVWFGGSIRSEKGLEMIEFKLKSSFYFTEYTEKC